MPEEPKKIFNVAIYARVSPTRKIQLKDEKTNEDIAYSLVKQLDKCRKYASANDDVIVKEYSDEYKSGKSIKYMDSFREMLSDAASKKFEKIYCARIDRFGRNLQDAVNSESKLRDLGVSIQFTEQGVNTSDRFGRMIFGILMSVAEWQRETIIENTSIGRDIARSEGVKFGRKPKEIDLETIKALNAQGFSLRKIASKLNVSPQTIKSRMNNET